MTDQDRNKKIIDILDREDYREQTPRKLMAAIEEVDGHAQRSKCPYCPAPPSQFTSLENCPGFVRCENCECEFLLVPKASAILTPAASDGVKDLAIGVARERIAELINERDQALSLVESLRARDEQWRMRMRDMREMLIGDKTGEVKRLCFDLIMDGPSHSSTVGGSND